MLTPPSGALIRGLRCLGGLLRDPSGEHPRERLRLPSPLRAPLGYDAVGVDAGLGPRVRRGLRRTGCVFADAERWWWIVPAQADIGLVWPEPARYAPGALVPARASGAGPCLTHWPEDDVPYTHPVMLYIVVCNVLGVRPDWSAVPADAAAARR
ncbi:hypothetical protein [Streptomyces glaucosporus]|uniref:hypothetical protein n=1 Tax=Streptomyces glaucosporus TaxID=284044 RepID=UPI0031E07DFF